MKRLIAVLMVLVVSLSINGFIMPATASPSEKNESFDPQKVMEAKIENLLNRNNVFGDDFTDNQKLVNKAAISLRSYAGEDGFIPEEIVISYIKDMYDINIVITDDINFDMPKKEGFVYLIPKGYSVYRHKILSVEETKDCITVISAVSAEYHDDCSSVGTAKTILIRNSSSAFGFSILSCDIDYNSVAAAV